MKAGDLVIVLYETRRYYVILRETVMPNRGERCFLLLGLKDGVKRVVPHSEIRLISEA